MSEDLSKFVFCNETAAVLVEGLEGVPEGLLFADEVLGKCFNEKA